MSDMSERWEPQLAKFDDRITSFKTDLKRLASDIATSEQQLESLETTESAFKRSKEGLVCQMNENEAELCSIADAFTEYGEDRRGVSSLQEELELQLDSIGHLKSEIERITTTCLEQDAETASLTAEEADHAAELAQIRQQLMDLERGVNTSTGSIAYADLQAMTERTRAADLQRKENDRLEAKLRKLQAATAKDTEMLNVIKEHVETISDDEGVHQDEDIMDVAALSAAAQAVPRMPLTPANRVNRQHAGSAGRAGRSASGLGRLTEKTTTTTTTRVTRLSKVAPPPQHMNSPGLIAASAKGLASRRFREERMGGGGGGGAAESSPLRPPRRGDRKKKTKARGGAGGAGGGRGVRFAANEMPGLTSGY